MRYNAISYLISEGLKNLLKNKKMSFASLAVILFTLIIFGIFFLFGENINGGIKKIAEKYDYKPIVIDALRKVVDGIVTLEEVNKKFKIY